MYHSTLFYRFLHALLFVPCNSAKTTVFYIADKKIFIYKNIFQSYKKIFIFMSSMSVYPYNISLKIKSFDIYQLHKICTYVKKMCKICGAQPLSVSFLPVKKKHISVCRSPHIHKKSRTQFVYKRHKAILCFGLYKSITLQETLFFLKTSILPGVEYELCISEKTTVL